MKSWRKQYFGEHRGNLFWKNSKTKKHDFSRNFDKLKQVQSECFLVFWMYCTAFAID